MRIVLQRVKEASVSVEAKLISKIDNGLLLLIAFNGFDYEDEIYFNKWAQKIVEMRIFSDSEGKMNLNVGQVEGSILAISQFTLYADIKHGNRPSFDPGIKFEDARNYYDKFVSLLQSEMVRHGFKGEVKKGVFGADMQVELLNDGPVTIIFDSEDLKKN